jgi:O-antigen/teichoic acid export membrane protein
MLLSPFNKLMLSRYAGVSTIPVYEIAYSGSMQVRSLIESGLRALMPEISRIGANMTGYARDRIAQLNYRAIKLILLFGLPVYAGLFVSCTFLFRIWLGERFVTVLPDAFRIMLIGTFLSLLGVPAFYTLMGTGHIRPCFASAVVSSFTHVAIVIIIVTFSGTVLVQNVAYAMVVAISGSTLYLTWELRRVRKRLVPCS